VDAVKACIKGWEKRGVYDDPKLTQIVETYEDLGFLVRLGPFQPEIKAGCIKCFKKNPDKYKVVYTKKNDSE